MIEFYAHPKSVSMCSWSWIIYIISKIHYNNIHQKGIISKRNWFKIHLSKRGISDIYAMSYIFNKLLKRGCTNLFINLLINISIKMLFYGQTEWNNNTTPNHFVKYIIKYTLHVLFKFWLPSEVYIQVKMATKTQDSDYSAEKRNNISEMKISLNTHLTTFGFVNST